MLISTPPIQNVIFDLGGVLLPLDFQRTFTAFGQLAGKPADDALRDAIIAQPFFLDYEKGLLSDADFRDELRRSLRLSASDEQIDAAWNALLLPIEQHSYELLRRVRQRFRIFLLSNTNEIHLQHFSAVVRRDTGGASLDEFFDRAYYSHRMNMRKPDTEIFERVLQENNLAADETVFLDDNLDNLRGAEQAGLHTRHIASISLVPSLFQ